MSEGKLNCGYVNSRNRPYYSRRCKADLTDIESLPDELVYNILLHLSAEDIYKGARLVCKKWNKMICNRKFVYAHLHNSTPGLLIQKSSQQHSDFVTIQHGKIDISTLSCKFAELVWNSCNGLIVDIDLEEVPSPYILNPATEFRFDLPPFDFKREFHFSIAYVAATMEYKVVISQYYWEYGISKLDCAILTVGVDKSWRHVCTKNLYRVSRELLRVVPLATEGFVHWAHGSGTHVLTLNAETEVITETPVPDGYGKRKKYYLSMGTSLALLIACGDLSWDVWELKRETGEWTKMIKIDLEDQRGKFALRVCPLRPVGWLNYREALVLHVIGTGVCLVYNLCTQKIDYLHFELDYAWNRHTFRFHRNSLVCL